MTSTARAPALVPSPAHQPTSSSGATNVPVDVYPTPDGLNRKHKSYDAQVKETWKCFGAGVEDVMRFLGEPIQEEVVKLKQD